MNIYRMNISLQQSSFIVFQVHFNKNYIFTYFSPTIQKNMPDIRNMWRFYVKYSDGLICRKIIKLCLIGVVLHIPYNKLRRRFYGSIIRVLPKWITVLKRIHNCSCVSYRSLQYQWYGCILNITSKKRYILNVYVSVFRVRNKYGTLRTSE